MKLEDQIKKLADFGLPLNDGIEINHFLLSWSRDEYEEKPFELILSVYGMEVEADPAGRFFCNRAWNFDHECIESSGDYVAIVKHLHRITGQRKVLTELSDRVDWETQSANLQYSIDGIHRNFDLQMNNDWVDPEVAQTVVNDFSGNGVHLFSIDNGQAEVWFCMEPQHASSLNALAGNVFGLAKRRWWQVWN